MVFKLHHRHWTGIQNLVLVSVSAVVLSVSSASAEDSHLREARTFYQNGQYFSAARYAFAGQDEGQPEAYSWITLGLAKAGLYNSASYFFIKTLQTGNKPAIRRVLTLTQELLSRVGVDVLRNFLVRHTTYEDYDGLNRSAFLFSLGKAALLNGQETQAIGYLNAVVPESLLYPYALQLRASAFAILGKDADAIRDFRACSKKAAGDESDFGDVSRDLKSRCFAGEARTLYQSDQFAEADKAYDRIPKGSFVWPDILFEQAWNSFGRREYNRSLGKLVSYKSPALSFVFNSEVDVLRAQSYLALCLYDDSNQVINEFNGKYAKIGEEVKVLVEKNSSNLPGFYQLGKEALAAPLHSRRDLYRMMNRFIRGPYFPSLVSAERTVATEHQAIKHFAAMSGGNAGQGFPAFLDQVLAWRTHSIQQLGGAFVKNSLMDYHSILISDFEKMAFIKLEMLGRAKNRLLQSHAVVASDDRSRGNVEPSRRDDQQFWSFNGEFWNDELGDYVFGLESVCTAKD